MVWWGPDKPIDKHRLWRNPPNSTIRRGRYKREGEAAFKCFERRGVQERLFDNEHRILTALPEHPEIIRLLDTVETKEHLVLVEEFFPGQRLSRLKDLFPGLERRRPIEELDNLLTGVGLVRLMTFLDIIGRKVLDALRVLEQHRVVHRDIAPSNIMIHNDYYPGTPSVPICLIDFATAMMPGVEDIAADGTPIGHPAYRPEEIRSSPVNATVSSDLYGFGVICREVYFGNHEAYYGQTQWARARESVLLEKRMTQYHLRPKASLAELCKADAYHDRYRELYALLDDLVKTDPGARPSSVDEVSSAVENSLAHWTRNSPTYRSMDLLPGSPWEHDLAMSIMTKAAQLFAVEAAVAFNTPLFESEDDDRIPRGFWEHDIVFGLLGTLMPAKGETPDSSLSLDGESTQEIIEGSEE